MSRRESPPPRGPPRSSAPGPRLSPGKKSCTRRCSTGTAPYAPPPAQSGPSRAPKARPQQKPRYTNPGTSSIVQEPLHPYHQSVPGLWGRSTFLRTYLPAFLSAHNTRLFLRSIYKRRLPARRVESQGNHCLLCFPPKRQPGGLNREEAYDILQSMGNSNVSIRVSAYLI